ncbi:hypothetical protein [Nannocystis sp.]|uniref:hypothetical protein n=1 Tax=Nannocystis sp. TaxID=1962667 RepID=UPI0024295025|nr:hypothetical protein [Nannocystis sp.]MBK7828963.1 hypothetical protein [Nannocystis sp.]MBK9757643.1 hypothetical protein [Nannocystis sp.]
MKNNTSIHAVLGAALLFATFSACGDNGGDTTGSTGDNTTNPSGSSTDSPTTTVSGSTTDNPSTTDTASTTDNPTTAGPTTTVDPDTGSTGGDPGFVFPQNPFSDYEQIDRHGAVEAGTAGIGAKEGLGFTKGQDVTIRDAYNASNPVEDIAGMWVPEIAKSVMFFHAALDDDLMGAGLTPATFDESIAQAGPVLIPDTIKYDPTKPTSYPNGRKLEDPVVDITLAAALVSLKKHPLTVLADLPLNPPKNDVAFSAEWPYLAPPHAP